MTLGLRAKSGQWIILRMIPCFHIDAAAALPLLGGDLVYLKVEARNSTKQICFDHSLAVLRCDFVIL